MHARARRPARPAPAGKPARERRTKQALVREIDRLEARLRRLESGERRRDGKTLPEQQTFYRLLTEYASDVLWVTDLSLNFTFVSPSVTRLQGFTVEEAVEGGLPRLLTPASLAIGGQVLMEELAIEKAGNAPLFRNRTFTVEYLCRDGRTGWAEVKTAFVRDESGRPIGVVGISRDITERKKIEDALKQTNELLRALITASPLSIITVDPGGRVAMWNPAAERMFGWTEAETVGRPAPVVPKSVMKDFSSIHESVTKGTSVTGIETTLLKKDGSTIDVNLSMNALRGAGGAVTGFMAIIEDVTERKRAEQEREKMQSLLLQAQKMEAIGQLAGGIAHDFNNLLTAIQGYTDMSLMSVPPDGPLCDDLKQIRKACTQAGGLTRQLLLFSRRQPYTLRPVDLNDTVTELLKMLDRVIGGHIQITSDLEPHLWSVLADTGCIEQVVMNLVVNARDVMPEGGTITIRTRNCDVDGSQRNIYDDARAGRFVCLGVQDTGCGIGKDLLTRIFEPFFSTKGPNGTGLGLSVVYGIVKQHDGWLDVESAPGRGSTFSIYLPASFEKSIDKKDRERPIEAYRGRGEKILVIEDEVPVKKIFVKMLQEHGFDVKAATSAREAMRVFRKEKGNFDLVFSDVVLPDTSGIKLVDRLLKQKPSLRVLISSGYTMDESDWKVIQQRGFTFLQKPYTFPDLLRMVKELLEKL